MRNVRHQLLKFTQDANRAFHWLFMWGVACMVFLTASPASAQTFRQIDGTTFGGGGDAFWGGVLDTAFNALCSPVAMLRFLVIAMGVVLSAWLTLKGAQGRRDAWGKIVAIVIVMAFVLNPGAWVHLIGLEGVADTMTRWNACR